MGKSDSRTDIPPPVGFSERELFIALRNDMTATDVRRLAKDMALAEQMAERRDRGVDAVDAPGELRVETNIAPYTLQLLACQGPEVERRVEAYMRRKGWLDDPAYSGWKDELERLRPVVTLRMQQIKEE